MLTINVGGKSNGTWYYSPAVAEKVAKGMRTRRERKGDTTPIEVVPVEEAS